MWSVTVYGTPAPKGSLKCVGARGRRGHALIEDDPTGKLAPWRRLVAIAGRRMLTKSGQLVGPVAIEATFTLARPKSAPVTVRPWPIVKPDLDKLQRTVLDGITDSGLWNDDAQAVEINARKTYPDTPACPDRLDRPGLLLRLWKADQ